MDGIKILDEWKAIVQFGTNYMGMGKSHEMSCWKRDLSEGPWPLDFMIPNYIKKSNNEY